MAQDGGMTLYHGDCLDILPTLPDASVDAIIADPPYGTTACKWDSVIPLAPMWAELKRVIKPRGAIVLFAAQPFTSVLVTSNLKWFKYAWVWEKEQGVNFQLVQRQPLKIHEDVCIFYDALGTYNPQGLLHCDITKSNNFKGGNLGHCASESKRKSYKQTQMSYPTTIQKFTREVGLHPTQKPVDLLRYLVRTYTNAGETVLDFTMGSGTTGVACVLEGRKFIGIELDKGYYDIAQKRIEEAAMQMPLFQLS